MASKEKRGEMNSEKFNELKKQVRSILLTYQKGCYLSEFNKIYRSLTGRKLPVTEFSFRSEIDLLRAMPDVVRYGRGSPGEPHLMGIADESTKHVQSMVRRQKPAKLKAPPRMTRFTNEFYASPPRVFTTQKSTKLNNKVYSSNAFPAQESSPFQSTHISVTPNSVPIINKVTSTPSEVHKQNPSVEGKRVSAKDEVISLVKYYRNGIPLTEILYEYEQMYDKSLSLSDFGFSSMEECIENITELDIIDKDHVPYAVHESEVSRLCENNLPSLPNNDYNKNHVQNSQSSEEMPVRPRPDSNNTSYSDSHLSPSMISKLEQVAKKYSRVIWSYEFPRYFEEITDNALDLHSLGYNCLADFIDDVPEIFRRKSVSGNKKDYIIYPASLDLNDLCGNDAAPLLGALLVEGVIFNLRQLLQANSEGLKLEHLEHIYKINCKGSLHASDFGFRDLETFLLSIKERVPLRCKIQNGVKIVYLVKHSETDIDLLSMSSYQCQEGPIPVDAASPKFKFQPLIFPEEFDFTQYVPVYVSNVVSPGHFYMQFQESKTTKAYGNLSDIMDDFYHGEQSSLYRMKNSHIQVGATCAALWPADQHWYRAQILAIPSMDKVKVKYIDYGTMEEIPTSLLRYMKKQYTDLPIQSLRCCLSFLQPAKHAATWSIESRNIFLKLCQDIPLMAKIDEKQPDGVYSIVLCDTNGENDVYINDILISEGYAEYRSEEPITESICSTIPSPVSAMPFSNISPIQALQGHQHLLLFASVLPSFSVNEHYLKLLQQVSMLCSSNFSVQQNMKMSDLTPAALNPFPSPLASMAQNNSSVYAAPFAPLNNVSGISSTDYPVTPPIRLPTPLDAESPGYPAAKNKDEECEIFEDDDDSFEIFCQEVATRNRRYVQRVRFGEGYKINIINYKEKAYASSGDVSQLLWNNKEPDYMFRRLQHKEVDLPTLTVYEDSDEELFKQLERFKVKGILRTCESTSILLYPLKEVIKILNIFGHPSAKLRTKIMEETTNFEPSDPVWKDYSTLDLAEHEDENYVVVTDDDKIKRLCLYDLQAMKDGINYKRLATMEKLKEGDSSKSVDEIRKLESMQSKVLKRIKEIEEICGLFS